MYIFKNIIEELVKSDISAYKFAQETGLSSNILTKLRLPKEHKDHRSIDNLSLKTADKIYKFAITNLSEQIIDVPEEELDIFFDWLVEQRLKAYPLMPEEGIFNNIPSTEFSNAYDYVDLVRATEMMYPQFSYNKRIIYLLQLY